MKPAPSVPLKDVEWRLDSEPKDGDRGTRARFVPHINARTAAALMDEWVGPMAWADEYRTVTIAGKEAILCSVSVWDGERWITKQDVGVPSHTEPQKGGISDAFKRTVTVKWGCGRNVYDLPTLWAPCKAVKGRDGKVRGYANDQTLPDLLRQLKQLGVDADGCRLEDGASDENAGGEAVSGVAADRLGGAVSDRTPTPPAPSPGPAGASANARGNPPTGPGEPSIGAATYQQLVARSRALRADNVSVADARMARQLPKLTKEISPEEGEAWAALLDDLERELEKPFVATEETAGV